MSRIIIPQRRIWARQPQIPAEIDRSNPITRGLVAVLSNGRDAVKTRNWTAPKGYSRPVSQHGIGTGLTAASRQYLYVDESVDHANHTLFAIAKPNSSTDGSVMSLGTASGSARITIAWLGGLFQIASDLGSSANSAPVSSGEYHAVCETSSGSITRRLYVNGVLTTGAVSVSSGLTRIYVGSQFYSEPDKFFDGDVPFAAVWSRPLTEAEVRSLTNNTWQIFKPRTRRTSIDLGAGSGTNTSLTISEALHAHNVDALLLSWQDLLTVSDSNHAHIADSLTLSTQWLLAVQEALHAHAADNIGLSATGSASLSVQDSTHAHLADALTLVTTWLLSVADSKHGHAAGNLTLDTGNATWLTVQESFHAHTADNVALTLDTWLAIVDAAHAHYADSLTLTVDAMLTIAQTLHAIYSDTLVLSLPGATSLTPDDIQSIAAAVLAALQATTIPVDTKKMNGAQVIGDGSEANPWRGVGV